MPEMFDDEAMELLQAKQQTINAAINELITHQRYGERFAPAEKASLIASIKANAMAGGVDLSDWEGSRRPDAPGGGPP